MMSRKNNRKRDKGDYYIWTTEWYKQDLDLNQDLNQNQART